MTSAEFENKVKHIMETLDKIESMINKNSDEIKENTAALIEAGVAMSKLSEKK